MGILGFLQNSLLVLRGFKGIVPISSPSNEPWVFIVLLLLFIALVFLVYNSDEILIGNLRNFVSEDDKSTNIFSVDRLKSNYFSVFLTFYSVGIFSLFIYLLLHNTGETITFANYCQLILITIGAYLFKIMSFKILGYVFFQKSLTQYIIKVYFSIFSVFTLVLYPIVVTYTYLPFFTKKYLITVSFLFFLIFFIVLIIKLFQHFFQRVIAFFYIILYLCTLEIIPLGVLFRIYSFFL